MPSLPDAQYIAIQGIPFDANSSFLRGPALAPAKIREAFYSASANAYTELGFNLEDSAQWHMVDDLALSGVQDPFGVITSGITSLLDRHYQVVSLGGDHSITYPIIRSYARAYPDLTIVQLDAHPDLYDEFEGNRFSHACPFARIMEENLASSLVQMGVRTMTQHNQAQAERFGVRTILMKDWHAGIAETISGPVYLTLDLDGFDPAFAPGVSHLEPGGFSARDVIDIIHRLPGPIVGADIVELNPTRDWMDMTAMLAAKCLKEILGRMLTPGQ